MSFTTDLKEVIKTELAALLTGDWVRDELYNLVMDNDDVADHFRMDEPDDEKFEKLENKVHVAVNRAVTRLAKLIYKKGVKIV